MLRITQSADAESALSYFDNGLEQGDYYSAEQEADSFWGGGLGLGFGVYKPTEKVSPTREQFELLVNNKHPVTGEQLTARNVTNRKIGYDFTFNAPKSLSIASEVLGQEAVRTSFVGAVETTMREIEADMMARVRKNGQNTNRVTGNMLYAGFVHRTSRPVKGIADPHLHAHCYIFNVTHDQEEAQFKAAEAGYICKNAPYYEAMFHSYLAEKLVELGYSIERNGRYVELAGMSKDLIKRYSRRTEEIEKIAELKGIVDAKEKAKLGAKTRENKSENTKDGTELVENWKSRLATSEEKLFTPSVPIMDRQAPSLKSEVLNKAIEHVFERKSVVSDKDLLAEALRLSYGTATIEELKEQLADRDDLMQKADGHGKAIMSKDVLKEEQAIVDFAQKTKDHCKAFSPTAEIKEDFLNAGQKQAVKNIWSSKDFITVLEGGAGVGKTTLAKIAVAGIEAQGQKVHMFAPSAQASRGVLRADGFKDANTVASLLHSQKKQASLKNQVIWIDEAGLLGTPTLHKVLSIAGEQNARVVLSGDVKQHKGVERGDALNLLYDHAGIEPIQVREIVRQKGLYKTVVSHIENGNLEEAFGRLNLMGGIVENESEVGRHEAINNHYLSAVINKESVLIVAPTHAEKDKTTASLRSHLKVMRRIGTEERTLATLKRKNLTKGEKQDPLIYKSGTVIQFTKATSDKEFRNKQQVTFVSQAGVGSINVVTSKGVSKVLNLAEYENFKVYEHSTLDITDGEKIRITDNGSTKDEHGKRHSLDSGAIYTVKKIQKNGDLLLTNGWVLPKDHKHIDYGYCSTSHGSQGMTVDHVIIAESEQSFGAASKEQFYVSASRGRKTCKVFTNNKEALLETVSKVRMAGNALDVWKGKQVTPSRRIQAVLTREQFLNSMPKQATLPAPKAQAQKSVLTPPEKVLKSLYDRPTQATAIPTEQLLERLEQVQQQRTQEEINVLNTLRVRPKKPTVIPSPRLQELNEQIQEARSLDRQIYGKDGDNFNFTRKDKPLLKREKELDKQIDENKAEREALESEHREAQRAVAIPSQPPEIIRQQQQRRKQAAKFIADEQQRQKEMIALKSLYDRPTQATAIPTELLLQKIAEAQKGLQNAVQQQADNAVLNINQEKQRQQEATQERLQTALNSMPKPVSQEAPKAQKEFEKLQIALKSLYDRPTQATALPTPQLLERLKQVRDMDIAKATQEAVKKAKQKLQPKAPQALQLPRKKKKKPKLEKFSVPEIFANQNKTTSPPPVALKIEKQAQPELEQDEGLELELSLEPDFE